jgi:hypothetical protein
MLDRPAAGYSTKNANTYRTPDRSAVEITINRGHH